MKARIEKLTTDHAGAMETFARQVDEAATKQIAEATTVADRTMESSHLSEAWKASQKQRLGDESNMLELLEQIDPVTARGLAESIAKADELQGVARSFAHLTQLLAMQRGGVVTKESARDIWSQPNSVVGHMWRINHALDRAGDSEAVRNFPYAQLKAIEKAALEKMDEIQAAADAQTTKKLTPAVSIGDVNAPKDAARVIGEQLGDPEVGAQLLAIHDRLPAEVRVNFSLNLSAVALLVDEANNAPDYDKTKMGWHHPDSRRDYRARGHDAISRLQSEDRQKASQASMREALGQIGGAKDPSAALESFLVETFVKEIGVSAEQSAGWKPNAPAIRRALEHEAFVPLRGLNETVQSMSPDPALTPEVQKAVSNITQHVVEGDYREWRYDNDISARQLSGLSDEQKAKWKDGLHTEYETPGLKLSTREEDDVELLWLTKIGGPSHGFDYGGHCLLPLLSNGRTKAILVDDPKWPHNAAARSYIRVIHKPDGSPTLYLEPFQRDFPHRGEFGPGPIDRHLYAAVISHAKQKADQLGLPLSIGPSYRPIVEALGFDVEAMDQALVLKASNGVFEASDTFGLGHDFHQQRDMTTPPLNRLWYTPEG